MTETAIEKKPWIVVVGGFLGAGKTTLILAAARELERHGRRCAVIMNDQGSELVDTRFADLQGLRSGEVTGGCFCCRLTDLVDAAEKLRAFSPDVIFAEPVGSCTDLLATVLRPLQEYQYKYKIAPFTVVVDPQRAILCYSRRQIQISVFFFESRSKKRILSASIKPICILLIRECPGAQYDK